MNYQTDNISAAFNEDGDLRISGEREAVTIPKDEVEQFLEWAQRKPFSREEVAEGLRDETITDY
jgi:hypothetical protein